MRVTPPAALFVLCTIAAGPAGAVTCEELVASIEGRIRANGVATFTVTAVDLAASAPGKQVGTCDAGRKKILYLRAVDPAAVPGRPAPASAAASRPGVITECADGRVIKEGSCKK